MRVLILEDYDSDADLIERETQEVLPQAQCKRAIYREEFIAALDNWRPELILADYTLPDFDGMEALGLARARCPDIPLLIVTGSIDEETAVACMRGGAWNYILKDRLSRLGPAIVDALKRRELEAANRRNLEALREREARYRSLFTNNHAVMLIIDPQSALIVDANPAAVAYYGWSRDELKGKKITELNTLPLAEVKAEMARAHSEQRRHFCFKHRRADGSTRAVEVFAGPITLEGRSLLYSIVHDIGERARVEEELQQAYDELKAAQSQLVQNEKMAAIGLLAAGVAHEINNPVGFVTSNLGSLAKYGRRLQQFIKRQDEVLKRCAEPESHRELAALARELRIDEILNDMPALIEESLEGTERVKTIVQSLKNFSRSDRQHEDWVDIHQCLEDTLRVVWNELKYKATVVKEYGQLPPIRGFPHELNQVLVNLLINAGQAISEQGEIRINTWSAGNNIHIAIADTGSGIAAEHLPRVFEPFFTTKEVGKGTGLGLSISYDIITRLHGGELTVDSEPGRGSVFTIRLPLSLAKRDKVEEDG
ncbi:MAG: ATP-binding protein [Desulfurivibrio sp.]|nr:ATP-binding protein [Desulfurivibrio sp.]